MSAAKWKRDDEGRYISADGRYIIFRGKAPVTNNTYYGVNECQPDGSVVTLAGRRAPVWGFYLLAEAKAFVQELGAS